MNQNKIKDELRAIVNTPARDLTKEQKERVRAIAGELSLSVKIKSNCNSCYHDAAIQCYNLIQLEQSRMQATESTARYVLRPNVDVFFGSVRVNAATLTDELAERILAQGFERKYFVKCE